MNWILVFISGLITYFLRYSMISLIKKDMLSERTKTLLGYVPSAVFPALILRPLLSLKPPLAITIKSISIHIPNPPNVSIINIAVSGLPT